MLPFFEIYLTSAFGGHFFIFGLYLRLLSQEEIDILPVIELQSFVVFANFRLQPLFYNLILKFLLRIRSLQDGMTSEDENFPDQERGRGPRHVEALTSSSHSSSKILTNGRHRMSSSSS